MQFTLSFHASGERYKPSKIAYAFTRKHDVGDIARAGRFKGQAYPYGSSEIAVADELPWKEKIPALVAAVLPLLALMKDQGADSFEISAGYFHGSQCNLEFSTDELRLLASLECTFCLSCYPAENEPNKAPEPTPGLVTPRALE